MQKAFASAIYICYDCRMALMTFTDFYNSLTKDERVSLASRSNTSINYLYQISAGIRKPGASLSARLKSADIRITDSMLRPDLYA